MKNKEQYKTAVILCGGRGTRLGLLGKKLPKTLIKVHKKPIIWYIIKILKKNSFNHFVLPMGYKGKMIQKYFKNNPDFKKYKIDLVRTGENASIANRIYKIRKNILSKNFILLNGDAIFNFNLKKIFYRHLKKKSYITFIGSDAQLNYGIVGMEKNKVKSFDRETQFYAVKSKNKKNLTGYIYSGISIINNKVLNLNFKNCINFEKEFYPSIIKKYKAHFESINGFWHSIDNQKDIEFLHSEENKFKYKQIKKIKKEIKLNEKKLLEK